MNSNRNGNGPDKKSHFDQNGGALSSKKHYPSDFGETRSINIQIKNKPFKDVSPLRRVLAVLDDSKVKDKASLRLNTGYGAALPKSPSML